MIVPPPSNPVVDIRPHRIRYSSLNVRLKISSDPWAMTHPSSAFQSQAVDPQTSIRFAFSGGKFINFWYSNANVNP